MNEPDEIDLAHESDMRKLRKRQLQSDISEDEAASELAIQVASARAEFDSWPDEKRRLFQLEGFDPFHHDR